MMHQTAIVISGGLSARKRGRRGKGTRYRRGRGPDEAPRAPFCYTLFGGSS